MKPVCHFELSTIEGGVRTCRASYRNLVVYSGYDLLALAVAGLGRINAMYLEFSNVEPSEPTIDISRSRSYYASLSGDSGYLRVTGLPAPTMSASSSNYKNNILTYLGSSDGAVAHGATFGTGSYIVSTALVWAPSASDPTQDVIYNAAAVMSGGVFAPLQKAVNIGIGLSAAIQFAGA